MIVLFLLLNLSLTFCVNAANLPALTDVTTFPPSAGVVSSDDTASFIISSSVGDFNGDGLQDFAIANPFADPQGRAFAGEIYVVFGSASLPSAINLTQFSASQGVRIFGANASDSAFTNCVGPAGDFNKDGISDLLIGFLGGSPFGLTNAGYGVIIFGGKSLPATIDLLTLTPSQGILVVGPVANGKFGCGVNEVGDVDGNGYTDVVMGRPSVTPPIAGEAYLLLGSATFPSVIDLASCTTTYAAYCVLIKGSSVGGLFGLTASSAGDINGDGISDFMIAAELNPSSLGELNSGQLFIFYGRKTFSSLIDLAVTVNFGGVVIEGSNSDYLGYHISPAGDMNQDGFGDILVGLQSNGSPDLSNGTVLYLVYGSNNLPALSKISGYPTAVTFLGSVQSFVSGNYDINQDGKIYLFVFSDETRNSQR